jgi:hypothetical protein
MDDGKYLLQLQLINPAPADPPNNVDVDVVPTAAWGYRFPSLSSQGCTVKSLSLRSEGDLLFNSSGVNIFVNLNSKSMATYLVDVKTTISYPIAMIKLNGDAVWPVAKTSGQMRVIISRIPDLLSV